MINNPIIALDFASAEEVYSFLTPLTNLSLLR